jgi:hypothetical protein
VLAWLGGWGVAPEAIPPVLVLEFVINVFFPILLLAIWRLANSFSRRN